MAGLRKFSQRKRNNVIRSRKPFIIIGCEGKNKTEQLYFRNFHSKNCIIKFSNGSSTDPLGIVQDILSYVDSEIGREENDKVYAVFDTDVNQNKQDQIEEAKKIADKNGVEIITSTPTFELWFLLHFRYTTKTFTSNSDLQNELKKHIPEYEKNNNTYLSVKDSTVQAINNAKKLEEYQIDIGQALDNENCNPYTSVYKIVEELIERNK